MKKIITLLTAVALLAASALALVSCKSPADKTSTTVYGFNYSVTKDKDAGEGFVGFATVKKYVLTDAQAEIVRNGNFYGNMLDLEVPAVYETEEGKYKVNAIAASAFADQALVKSVKIGDNVTSIGEACLAGCVNLESVTVPFAGASENAVGYKKTVGYLFGITETSGCTLTTVYHNDGDSDNSKSYYIPDSLVTVTLTGDVISEYAFNGLAVKNVVLSGSPEVVPAGAFANMTKISTVVLPESVTVIEKGAFKNSSVIDVNFADLEDLKAIGAEAFYGCARLAEFAPADSLEVLGAKAFYNASALKSVSVAETAVTALPEYVFYGCSKLESVFLPAGVALAKGAFVRCPELKTVKAGDGYVTPSYDGAKQAFDDNYLNSFS